MLLLHCKPSFIILYALFCLDYLMSLELTELRVPTHVPLGIKSVLVCRWSLVSTDMLYSVKWYKDGKEFFRHVPKDHAPFRKFLLPGVDVEEFDSSGSKLILAPAVLASSGRYRCEVSGERPHFRTVSVYADLLVVVLPSDGMSILGFESRYHVGDHVNISCLYERSMAPVNLAWYVNGNPALLNVIPQPMYAADFRETTSLGLQFTIVESLLGNLKLQCIATASNIYWRSIEKMVIVSGTLEDTEETHVSKDSIVLSYPRYVNSGLKRSQQEYIFVITSLTLLCYLTLIMK